MSRTPRLRCAVYTRKSSDEGLDQAFNSLDAQFDACSAYIASQRAEGWRQVSTRYDDGGVSGATLERPGLTRLLADIDAGRIDMIVVYKIDRLTRSLADFARLIERLDKANCSFVSVTQAFNTATSMGRLTLNVLLSFAQFEREVTAERIRDKIAASKQKGCWMGGLPPLGYAPDPDPNTRSLVVVPEEAEAVRTLFRLYDELGCLGAVEAAARERGIRSKHRVFASGLARGGKPLTRGQIHYLLTNPVYRGRIRHRDAEYPGAHAAIVEEPLWQRVQERLQMAAARPRGRRRGAGQAAAGRGPNAPLAGRLTDETGDRLTPTHTTRAGRRFRYYVSRRLLTGGAASDATGWRLPAGDLHAAVRDALTAHLRQLADAPWSLGAVTPASSRALGPALARLVAEIAADPTWALRTLVAAVQIAPGNLTIRLAPDRLAAALDLPTPPPGADTCTIVAPVQLRRRGVEARLAIGDRRPAPDAVLCRALGAAQRWRDQLIAGTPLAEIARQDGIAEAQLRSRLPLAFLSPRIQAAILEGRQPPDLCLERIVRGGVPLDWAAQARRFGFEAAGAVA